MNRQEAIKELEKHTWEFVDIQVDYSRIEEAIDMAIEALTDAINEDGTLTVHVSDGSKVKRVLVLGDNNYGGLYYADGDDDDDKWTPETIQGE